MVGGRPADVQADDYPRGATGATRPPGDAPRPRDGAQHLPRQPGDYPMAQGPGRGRPARVYFLRGPRSRRGAAVRVLRVGAAAPAPAVQPRCRGRPGAVPGHRSRAVPHGDPRSGRKRLRMRQIGAACLVLCCWLGPEARGLGPVLFAAQAPPSPSASARQAPPSPSASAWEAPPSPVASAFAGATADRSARQAPAATPPALQLVVPFDNESGEPRIYWLSEGSAVLLTDDLGSLGVPVIRREDRLRAFDRLRVPPIATLSHATVIRLGQVVGAVQVVIGSFQVDGADLVVRARTIRLDTGRISTELIERG